MRRIIALIVTALTVAVAMTGCRPVVEEAQSIAIYASFYPIYALTEAVMRQAPDARLHLLVQPQDGCLRSYQLSDWDLYLLLSGADGVIMGGRGLESFESTLFAWGDDGPAMSAVLYNLELYNQGQAVSGESESHLTGANPHLYMSLEGAKQILESISAAMQSMDPQYGQLYAENAQEASGQLDALLKENRAMLDDAPGQRVVLMNEALIYAARDYGFEVADWVDRESGEALYDEALMDCLERLKSAEAEIVLIEKQAPQAFVESIEAAGFAVARLDVLSTHREDEGFDRYLEIQKSNAQAIREALDRAEAGEDMH